jgi:tetratricopeptide (TPR) repeat protein
MRKFFVMVTVLLTVLIDPFPGLFGEDAALRTGPALRTDHYEIYASLRSADAAAAAVERIAVDLEGRFEVYNRLFRFDGASRMKVRIFDETGAYDDYVRGRLGETRPGAVYLHYSRPERRELVLSYPDAGIDDTGGKRPLPYQAFVQYLRTFVPNPPSWIQEGFALYFSTVNISAAGELGYTENLSWLEKVKKMEIPPAESILLADETLFAAPFPPEDLPALSWAMVSFFLNSGNEDYFRSLLESFMLLSPEKNAAENSLAVAERIKKWNSFENVTLDMAAYLAARKTFSGLMEEGRAAYGTGDYMTAASYFSDAMEQRPNHYAPYYYLGLIHYGNGSWYAAEQSYNRSLELGADRALVYYALGLNAAGEGLIEKAAVLLRNAAEEDPARYREKTEALLKRLGV